MSLSRRQIAFGVAGAALIGGPSLAQNLPPYRFDPANPGSTVLLRVGTDALRLKTKAIASIAGARDLMAPEVAATLPGLGILPSDAIDTVWALFFQNAQLYVAHARSDTPVVAFFNPIMDLWWATLWSPANRRAEKAKLVAGGRLFPGQTSPAEALPAWRRQMQRVPIIEALQRCGRTGDTEFGKIFPFESASPPKVFDRLSPTPASVLIERALGQAASIKALAATGRVYASYDVLMEALSRGVVGAARLSAEARGAFGELIKISPIIRKQLSPVAVARVETTWFVVSSTPLSGRYVVLSAHRETPDGGEVSRLTLVDLFGGAMS